MKVLVTGTAGFIGSHVALKLLERSDQVIDFDNSSADKSVANFVRWYRHYYCP